MVDLKLMTHLSETKLKYCKAEKESKRSGKGRGRCNTPTPYNLSAARLHNVGTSRGVGKSIGVNGWLYIYFHRRVT